MNRIWEVVRRRVLGIDYGQRRVGLAVSDPLGITAQGLKTMDRKSYRQFIEGLTELISRLEIEEIVVGLPLNMDGSKGEKAAQIENLVQRLRKRFGIPIIPWDERLTSVAAQRTMGELRQKVKGRKGEIDSIAAQLMLQSYLDSCRQEEKG